MSQKLNERLAASILGELRNLVERVQDVQAKALHQQGDDRAADKLQKLDVYELLTASGLLPNAADVPIPPQMRVQMERVQELEDQLKSKLSEVGVLERKLRGQV